MTNTVVEQQDAVIDQNSINLAILMWIGTIFFGFIPGLILYFVKKEDNFVMTHSREALNWSITSIIAYIVGLILSIIIIGVFLIWAIWICHLIFSILGAKKASNADKFRVPMTFRLIK